MPQVTALKKHIAKKLEIVDSFVKNRKGSDIVVHLTLRGGGDLDLDPRTGKGVYCAQELCLARVLTKNGDGWKAATTYMDDLESLNKALAVAEGPSGVKTAWSGLSRPANDPSSNAVTEASELLDYTGQRILNRWSDTPLNPHTLLLKDWRQWVVIADASGNRATDYQEQRVVLTRIETPRGAVVDGFIDRNLQKKPEIESFTQRLLTAHKLFSEPMAPVDLTLPCLLKPSVAAVMVYGLSWLLRGPVIVGSPSLKKLQGRRIFPACLSLVDQAGGRAFDDEGTACQKVTLIRNGVLEDFLQTRASAMALEMETNGRAFYQEAEMLPSAQPLDLGVLPGQEALPDHYIEMTSRLETFAVMSKSGVITLIAGGFEVKDGKRIKAVGPFNLDLPLLKTWRMLQAVGSKDEEFPALECRTPSLLFGPLAEMALPFRALKILQQQR